jgi:RNA polymerase sigma factor (sigma-70 family)
VVPNWGNRPVLNEEILQACISRTFEEFTADRRGVGEDEWAEQELAELISAVQSLPDLPRQVITLRKVYGYTQAQIADHLNLSSKQVERYLCQAAQAIVTQMSQYTSAPAHSTTGRADH